MTEQKPQRKGRDFLIGFLSGLAPLTLSLLLMNTGNSSFENLGLMLFLGGTVLLFIAMILLLCLRKVFVGLGIFALFVTAPLLIYGACS
jgi:hypothetical protein